MNRMNIRYLSSIATFLLLSFSLAESGLPPINLADSIEMGISNNADIKQAKEDCNKSQWQINSAWATIFPKLSLEYSFLRADSQQTAMLYNGIEGMIKAAVPTAPSVSLPAYSDVYDVKLTAQQLIWGSQVMPALSLAENNRLSTLANYNNIKSDMVYKVKQAYLTVLKSQELLGSAKENKRKIEELAKQTDELISQDMGTPVDQLRMQMQVKTAQQSIFAAENNLSSALLQLNLLLGFPITQVTPIVGISLNYQEGSVGRLDDKPLLTRMINNRQDLAMLNIQEKMLKEQSILTNSGRLPIVLLNGSYGYMNFYGSNFNTDTDRDWSIYLLAKWNFFDGGDTQSKVDDLQSNLNKLHVKRENLLASFEVDLRTVLNDLNLAMTKVQTEQKQVELAKEIERIGRERYKAGYFSSFELIDSQTTRFNAQTDLINALYDLEIVKARLNKVVGENVDL